MPWQATAFICALFLAGCSTFEAQPKTSTVPVTWVLVDNAHQACRSIGVEAKIGIEIKGCATFANDQSWCTVYTNRETSYEILGHELRHCFEGKFHE